MRIARKDLKFLASLCKRLGRKKDYRIFVAPHGDRLYMGLAEGRYALMADIGEASEFGGVCEFYIEPSICGVLKSSVEISIKDGMIFLDNVPIEPSHLYDKDSSEAKAFPYLKLIDKVRNGVEPETYFAFNPDFLHIGNRWLDGDMARHPVPMVEHSTGHHTLAKWGTADKMFFCMSFHRA